MLLSLNMENSEKSQPKPPQPPPPPSNSGINISDSGFPSSSVLRQYPPRLYKAGKSLIQKHSMNHYSAMSNLSKVRHELEDDLLVDDAHEIWSLIDDQPLRFSLHEYAAFTGLNCDPIKTFEVCTLRYEEFWMEMGISTATGPTYEELVKVIARSHLWHLDKRLMVAQLCFLSVMVFGIHKGYRIPLETAKRVLDKEAFEKHPWGRVSFQNLIPSIKVMKFSEKSYTLQGHVQVLLTWMYEHVVGIGVSYGKRRVKKNEEDLDEVPHMNWESGRRTLNFDHFIMKEKAQHGKMRVKHMIDVPATDTFPMWSKGDKIDPLLLKLIEDIMSGKLRANPWSEDASKKKWKVLADVAETST